LRFDIAKKNSKRILNRDNVLISNFQVTNSAARS
jgi:hypothetical protein